MTIRPLRDKVLVERIEEVKKTAGGIIIPDSASEKPSQGVIKAVGKGKVDSNNGKLIPTEVKVGDVVMFGQYAGNEIKDGEKTLLIMSEDEITAVIE